ncbi:MAG TPA: MBL fold metallo-hydrolase [Gemmatimonadales bacterium]|nr:MBL fold metallo-hydrolase [Gemmatimonadales bacterium]
MRLTVLGSGSRGNALLLEHGDSALLVDAGFSFRELCSRCEAAGRDPARITAIVLTHEHGDHARGAAVAAARWGVPVAASRGTLAKLDEELPAETQRIALEVTRPVELAGLSVHCFPTAHDAAEPLALVLVSPEGRSIGVAYDVGSPTVALRHALRSLDAMVIEANHDEVLLRAGAYPPSVRSRIAGRGGHLSNRQAAELLADAAHSGLSLVVLAHLSVECNRPELAEKAARRALARTAFRGRIIVASQDQPSATLEIGESALQLALPLTPSA